MSTEASTNPIDAVMERASEALAATRFFEAADLCRDALRRARNADDFGRMARICLPLSPSLVPRAPSPPVGGAC